MSVAEFDADVVVDARDCIFGRVASNVAERALDGETVVVPGKVLGSGVLQKDVTVAAVDFSGTAQTKIDQVGDTMKLETAVEQNPDGSNVRVIR